MAGCRLLLVSHDDQDVGPIHLDSFQVKAPATIYFGG
jgi:hypothetical protein